MALDKFIGQDALKQQVRSLIKLARNTGDLLPHLLLSGPPEMGKATLARALSKEAGVGTHILPTAVLKKLDFIGVVTNIRAHEIAIIEEIQDLKGEVQGLIENMLAKGTIDVVIGTGPGSRPIGIDLPPFTLIATTSRSWQVPTSLRRWFVTLEFAPYSVQEIAQIVRNLAATDGLTLEPEAARLIAGQCNGTPGNASAILKRIKAHYGRLVIGAKVDEELARRLLTLLGYGDAESGVVALADRLRLMTGAQFEEFVAGLFRNLGYIAQLTSGSGDHGVDILIRKAGQLGAVQCKRWTDAVGEPVIRDFLGSMLGCSATIGYVAATATFTDQAKAFAHKHSVQLLDLDALLRMANSDTRASSPRPLF